MVKKQTHPDIQLFDYLNGTVEAGAASIVEGHLSVCEECSSLAALIGKLKDLASAPILETNSYVSDRTSLGREHPDISELASFFYANLPKADSSRVAVHVAMCDSCTEAIAQYAGAERAASQYESAKTLTGEVPAKAWEMIHDWEESSFAELKPAGEALGEDLLKRLLSLFDDRKRQVSERDHQVSGTHDAVRIPVFVVSRSGEIRGIEFFERVVDATGVNVLKHAEGSQRFDNRLVHALLDYGEKEPVLISKAIKYDTLRLEHTGREADNPRRVGYFIIEEGRE